MYSEFYVHHTRERSTWDLLSRIKHFLRSPIFHFRILVANLQPSRF